MLLNADAPALAVTRTASSATTAAKLVRPIAARTSTGLRGSRASRYRPSHQLSEKTNADSAAMVQVWHGRQRPSRSDCTAAEPLRLHSGRAAQIAQRVRVPQRPYRRWRAV